MQTSLFTLTSQVCQYPQGLTFHPCTLTFWRAPKARAREFKQAPDPKLAPWRKPRDSLVLHFLSFLCGVGTRHEHVTSMKPIQRRAEAGAQGFHEGTEVPGVKCEVGCLGWVLFCKFGVFTCLSCCRKNTGLWEAIYQSHIYILGI